MHKEKASVVVEGSEDGLVKEIETEMARAVEAKVFTDNSKLRTIESGYKERERHFTGRIAWT